MSRLKKLLVDGLWLAAFVSSFIVFGWLMGPSGTTSGVEFSPDLFCHRSFVYRQWFGFTYWNGSRQWKSAVDQYLHDNGYVSDISGAPRWHLAKGFAPGVRGWHGRAKYMCQAVGCYSGDDNRWVNWSQANPEAASVVWPQVVTWAREEQYTAIAELFSTLDSEAPITAEDARSAIRAAAKNGDQTVAM